MSRYLQGLTVLILVALAGCTAQQQKPDATIAGARSAKNVILFIGDGMGVSTVTAARIFDGQSKGLQGEEHVLAFERFEHIALSKTYNTNQQVPDSAGTATAMLTGQKTRAGVIGISQHAKRRDCEAALANPLESIGGKAKKRGMSVGFVTTTRATHATPAALYAHSPERDWEVDTFVPPADWAIGCRDTAWQLTHLSPGNELDIAMGGGRKFFLGSEHGGVRRAPDDDLVRDWLEGNAKRRYISTADELATIEPGDQVLGLFANSHMTYIAERSEQTTEPTLSQMTAAAIDLLAANEDGFFLLVEGGRIDHGHHDGRPGYAMLEAQEFNRAVETALKKINLQDTLVIVTADHSHVFTMGGYATRGNPILGLVVMNDKSGEPDDAPALAADGVPYTTLSYANGPGSVDELPRPTPETGVNALAQTLFRIVYTNIDGSISASETHGGEDVAVYAAGPGADKVRGVIEQNLIYNIMTGALGWDRDEP